MHEPPAERRGQSRRPPVFASRFQPELVAAVPDNCGSTRGAGGGRVARGSRPCITTCLPQNATFPRLSLATSSSSPLSSSSPPPNRPSLAVRRPSSPGSTIPSSSSIQSAFSLPSHSVRFLPSAPSIARPHPFFHCRPPFSPRACVASCLAPRARRPFASNHSPTILRSLP